TNSALMLDRLCMRYGPRGGAGVIVAAQRSLEEKRHGRRDRSCRESDLDLPGRTLRGRHGQAGASVPRGEPPLLRQRRRRSLPAAREVVRICEGPGIAEVEGAPANGPHRVDRLFWPGNGVREGRVLDPPPL